MLEYYPLLVVGGLIGIVTTILIIAYTTMKDKAEAIGFDRKMKDGELIRRLIGYAKPFSKNFFAVMLIMLVSVAFSIASPLMVSDIEGMMRQNFALDDLISKVIIYGVLLVISLIGSYVQAVILQITGQKIVSSIREDLFSHIESLSHGQLNKMPVGKLVTRVTNDTNAISVMFTNIIVNLIQNCFVVVAVYIAMMCINQALTLMISCFVPFIVLFSVLFRKFSRRAHRRVKDRTTDINTFLSENLSGMKIIQIFNRENKKMNDFSEKNEALYKAQRNQILVFGVFRPIIYVLYISTILCLFFLAGKGYIDGITFFGQTITDQTVVAFYMYINRFYNPIQNLAEQFHRLQSAFASAEKIFTILDMQPEVIDAPDAVDLDEVRGDIEFRHVWFSYVPDEWVLKDVSFSIKAGQTVAFVGATGSGKTTILSLLCRNYDIQKGEILLDGVNINKIRISSLRKHFGQMLQDVFLFAGTVRSNIVLRDEFSDDEINEVCRYVNADKFVSKLQNGLDEEVRERGNNFSAGQRQLLSFARTIIHRPEVMILDEATANIDTETEVLIQDSLERMMNIGTMIIVAHRLSTVQHADNIIVLSDGKIIEQGSHNELLEKKGRYYGLYMLQYDKKRISEGIENTI